MHCGKTGVHEHVCKWLNHNEFIEPHNIHNYIISKKKKKKKQRTCLFGKGVLSQRQRQFLQRDAGHVIVSPNILIL